MAPVLVFLGTRVVVGKLIGRSFDRGATVFLRSGCSFASAAQRCVEQHSANSHILTVPIELGSAAMWRACRRTRALVDGATWLPDSIYCPLLASEAHDFVKKVNPVLPSPLFWNGIVAEDAFTQHAFSTVGGECPSAGIDR